MRGRLGRLDKALIAIIVILLGVVGWQWWSSWTVDRLDYPEQVVANRLPGITGPAALVTDTLIVSAQKCVIGDAPITVTGVLSWRSEVPVVTVIEEARGVATRKPGPCFATTFLNPVPGEVRARTEQMLDLTGGTCARWRITGVDTPTDHRIRPETWQTQPIWVCLHAPAIDPDDPGGTP